MRHNVDTDLLDAVRRLYSMASSAQVGGGAPARDDTAEAVAGRRRAAEEEAVRRRAAEWEAWRRRTAVLEARRVRKAEAKAARRREVEVAAAAAVCAAARLAAAERAIAERARVVVAIAALERRDAAERSAALAVLAAVFGGCLSLRGSGCGYELGCGSSEADAEFRVYISQKHEANRRQTGWDSPTSRSQRAPSARPRQAVSLRWRAQAFAREWPEAAPQALAC